MPTDAEQDYWRQRAAREALEDRRVDQARDYLELLGVVVGVVTLLAVVLGTGHSWWGWW